MISIPVWLFVLFIVFSTIGGLVFLIAAILLIMGMILSISYHKSKEEEIVDKCPYKVSGKGENDNADA